MLVVVLVVVVVVVALVVSVCVGVGGGGRDEVVSEHQEGSARMRTYRHGDAVNVTANCIDGMCAWVWVVVATVVCLCMCVWAWVVVRETSW